MLLMDRADIPFSSRNLVRGILLRKVITQQGNVIVKPKLLIFKLLAGYGYFFLDYALT